MNKKKISTIEYNYINQFILNKKCNQFKELKSFSSYRRRIQIFKKYHYIFLLFCISMKINIEHASLLETERMAE